MLCCNTVLVLVIKVVNSKYLTNTDKGRRISNKISTPAESIWMNFAVGIFNTYSQHQVLNAPKLTDPRPDRTQRHPLGPVPEWTMVLHCWHSYGVLHVISVITSDTILLFLCVVPFYIEITLNDTEHGSRALTCDCRAWKI